MRIFTHALLNAVFLLWAFGTPAFAIEKGTQRSPDTADLKPDEYTWNPEASSTGPVGIIVDLTNQIIYVYRGGSRFCMLALLVVQKIYRIPWHLR